MKKDDVIKMLIEVARSAWNLADNTCEEDTEKQTIFTIDEHDFDRLSKALDALDDLPEPGPNLVGTGPAKAEAFLKKQDEISATNKIVSGFCVLESIDRNKL